jgi:hypothetical protein
MINLLLHHLQTIVLAGLGWYTIPTSEPGPVSAPLSEPCVSLVTVRATVTDGVMAVTATPDQGLLCSAWPCSFVANANTSSVPVSFEQGGGSFLYLEANGTSGVVSLSTKDITPTQGGASVTFAVVGYHNAKLIFEPDPKITVTTGTCGGGPP